MAVRPILSNLLITAAAVCVGAFLAEAIYRVRIASINDQVYVLQPRTPSTVSAFSQSPWIYDEQEGFRYARDRKVIIGTVTDGRLVCGPHPEIGVDGAPGKVEGDYTTAEVKIAVFGDSFGNFALEDGEPWPFLLQRELAARTHRTVHVYNATRDGYGLLQIFDTAALRLDELRPDLVILAYATDNMASPRIWRQEVIVKGEPRALTTFEPGPPDLARAVDTVLLAPEIAPETCSDPTQHGSAARAIINRYLRIRPAQSIFALDHSYLLYRLRFRNPLRQDSVLSADDVEHDAKLVGAAMKLHSYPAPVVLLRTPYLPEIQTGRFPMQDFLRAVERRSGFRSISMMEAMPHFDDPASLAFSAENLHPSAAGRRAYAIATADLLLKRFPAVFSGQAAQPH